MFTSHQQEPAAVRTRLSKPSRLWIALAALVALSLCITSVNAFAKVTPAEIEACQRLNEERERLRQVEENLTPEERRNPFIRLSKTMETPEMCQLRGPCEGLP
ncbi:hypothetical protein BGZ95_008313, partial [Linnemannia exigua]